MLLAVKAESRGRAAHLFPRLGRAGEAVGLAGGESGGRREPRRSVSEAGLPAEAGVRALGRLGQLLLSDFPGGAKWCIGAWRGHGRG